MNYRDSKNWIDSNRSTTRLTFAWHLDAGSNVFVSFSTGVGKTEAAATSVTFLRNHKWLVLIFILTLTLTLSDRLSAMVYQQLTFPLQLAIYLAFGITEVRSFH